MTTDASAVAARPPTNWPDTIKKLEAILDRGSDDVVHYAKLAQAYRVTGQFEKANVVLARGEEIDPSDDRIVRERRTLESKSKAAASGAPGNVYYGSMARDYQAKRETQRRWQTENAVVEALLKKVKPEGKVLDLPYGTGRFATAYHELGMTVTGVDISHDMLAAAQERYGDILNRTTLEIGDATRLSYLDNTFDTVVSVRFLQNIIPIADVRKALAEMARVCRGKAILEFEVRKPESVDAPAPAEDQPIRGSLKIEAIEALLSTAGFVLEESVSAYDNGASEFRILLCAVK